MLRGVSETRKGTVLGAGAMGSELLLGKMKWAENESGHGCTLV